MTDSYNAVMALKTSSSAQRSRGASAFLARVENPRAKIQIGGRAFSAEDLAEEVKRGSLLGRVLSKILRKSTRTYEDRL